MVHMVDFFTRRFGVGGNIIVALIFILLAVVGVVIAMRGRGAMTWIVGVCGFVCGVLLGAMVGILVFNSLILMIIFASVGGVLLLYTVKNVKTIGYFLGIGSLGWFLAYIITSEMYTTDTSVTENTLLFIDLVAGLAMGFFAALRSKYIVSVITALAGGVIAAISTLALLGQYFADAKMWFIAVAVALAGLAAQINTYDLKSAKKKNKRR